VFFLLEATERAPKRRDPNGMRNVDLEVLMEFSSYFISWKGDQSML
jgi:hypothetical protein